MLTTTTCPDLPDLAVEYFLQNLLVSLQWGQCSTQLVAPCHKIFICAARLFYQKEQKHYRYQVCREGVCGRLCRDAACVLQCIVSTPLSSNPLSSTPCTCAMAATDVLSAVGAAAFAPLVNAAANMVPTSACVRDQYVYKTYTHSTPLVHNTPAMQ